MIALKKVSKKYGNEYVLNDISFTVEPGEFISVIGSSGAGKTTLINAIIAATDIDSGSIMVDNFRIHNLNPVKIQEYRSGIGIVFQDYKLLPQKTVFENVAFALEVRGYDEEFVAKRVAEVLHITGLESKRNLFPHNLAGGESQRTAIARALVHAPDLLIADEPTGNLDPENAVALAKLLLKINKSGTTIILATHNREVVDTIQRRVITLDEGRIISDRKQAKYN